MFRRQLLEQIIPFWLFAVVVGSFLPYEAKRSIGTPDLVFTHSLTLAESLELTPHRLYHLLVFGATALLLMAVARSRAGEVTGATATVLMGVGIEFAQAVVAHYQIEWWDIRDDTLAVLAAYLLIQWPRFRATLLQGEVIQT